MNNDGPRTRSAGRLLLKIVSTNCELKSMSMSGGEISQLLDKWTDNNSRLRIHWDLFQFRTERSCTIDSNEINLEMMYKFGATLTKNF